ncbi:hypothetical protein HOE67_00745 [Candidatus Peregrinibacteria bacterium]|nr:hypothetical protein [Candidatus Peregrinibacteria bacterium]MBT4055616.1 hypothetical protein [Candidatus Peregrinibacteria bacterium]
MQIQVQYKNLSKSEQALFDEYMKSKIKQIDNLLTNFEEDAVMLDLKIEKFNKHDAFEVEYVLKIPMKTLKSREASHQITKAVDLAKDRLIVQLKKFQKQLKTGQLAARQHASLRRPKLHEETQLEKEAKQFLKA